MRHLLDKDSKSRYSIDEVLAHPWLMSLKKMPLPGLKLKWPAHINNTNLIKIDTLKPTICKILAQAYIRSFCYIKNCLICTSTHHTTIYELLFGQLPATNWNTNNILSVLQNIKKNFIQKFSISHHLKKSFILCFSVLGDFHVI